MIETTSQMIEFTRFYLAIFYSFVALFYTTRILVMKKSAARGLVFPGQRFCATWWNHLLFRLFRVAIWMTCIVRVFFPTIDDYLGMITGFENLLTIFLGNMLLTLGFIFTVIIHFRLGKEWRSGIDPEGPASIITDRLYKYSRNPMFLCIAISQIGFFLALPSMFSLVCLLVGLYTLNRQALSEEKHLHKAFPAEYSSYCAKVRRWI